MLDEHRIGGDSQDDLVIDRHPNLPGLLDLDHAAAGGFLHFAGTLDNTMGEGEQRLGVRRLGAFQHDWLAAVPPLRMSGSNSMLPSPPVYLGEVNSGSRRG
jgi:hypothetical protein